MEIRTRKREIRESVSLDPLTFVTSLEGLENLKKTDNPMDCFKSLLTAEELLELEIEERQFLLEGLLAEETITLINGERGIGKSWFAWMIANAVSSGVNLGPWRIQHSVDTVIIDGEMSVREAHKRMTLLRAIPDRTSKLYIWSDSFGYRIGVKRMNLLDEKWRMHIRENVMELGIKLIILDNLSSLTPGIDENAKMDFDPINRWLLELRYDHITIIMVHHTGKSGQQRGTSAHEDHVDTSLMLSKMNGSNGKGCCFNLEVTKDRANILNGESMNLALYSTEIGGLDFQISIPEGKQYRKAINLLQQNPNINFTEALAFGVKKTSFYKAKKDMQNSLKRSVSPLRTPTEFVGDANSPNEPSKRMTNAGLA